MTWYENDVKELENKRSGYAYAPETLFYGSSSIRMWETLYQDFAGYKPANLGFGGSTLAACVWFFDRIIVPMSPKRIVFYAGDNDLGDGRHAEEVFIFFQQLLVRVRQSCGDIPFAFISIKPSIARLALKGTIQYTNQLVESEVKKYPNTHYINIFNSMIDSQGNPVSDFFMPDGLHLSAKGYALWKGTVLNYLQNL